MSREGARGHVQRRASRAQRKARFSQIQCMCVAKLNALKICSPADYGSSIPTATDPKLTKPFKEQWDAIFGPQDVPKEEPPKEEPEAPAPAQDEPAEDESQPFGFGAFHRQRVDDGRKLAHKVPRTMPPGNDPRERSEGDSDVRGRSGCPPKSFTQRID